MLPRRDSLYLHVRNDHQVSIRLAKALQSRTLQVEHGAYEYAGPRERAPTTSSARCSVLMLANTSGIMS
jgi:hypothetical protein